MGNLTLLYHCLLPGWGRGCTLWWRARRHCRDCRRLAIQLDGLFGNESEPGAQFDVPRRPGIRVILQELAGILASLSAPLSVIAEPRTALLDDRVGRSEVDEIAFLGNP